MKPIFLRLIAPIFFCLAIPTAYASDTPNLGGECEHLLKQAEHAMADAKARGLGGAVEITKAAGLITAARIQQQFKKYPNCIDKAHRAIKFIHRAQQP